MSEPEFEFDDAGRGRADIAGSPEGDGDFETDGLPSAGETSAGGQVDASGAERGKGGAPRAGVAAPHKPTGLELIIDEISTGKIMP
jgi:hypothetical protein